jgi:pantothenate kinase-related protein Tda10
MKFDFAQDSHIFDDLIENRPELSEENLKRDLDLYYLPYVEKLEEIKKNKDTLDGVIVGVSAIQGTGKTTQGEILEILLKHIGYSSVSRSIDDHYITHKELCELRERDPRFIRRGVTHDVALAIINLRDLQQMRDDPIIISGYDKGVHSGDGDRLRWVNVEGPDVCLKFRISEQELRINKEVQKSLATDIQELWIDGYEIKVPERMGSNIPLHEHFFPKELIDYLTEHKDQLFELLEKNEDNLYLKGNNIPEFVLPKKSLPNGWRLIRQKPDFIFYDGWMLGAREVEDTSVFDSGLPALETEEAKDFAKMVNKKLDNYIMLWAMIEFMNVLYVPNYDMSVKWRDQAEEHLREKGEGMTHDQITEFVHYFWRSVHPAIHIKNLAHNEFHAQQVVIINDDHTVKEVLLPEEVKEKYP